MHRVVQTILKAGFPMKRLFISFLVCIFFFGTFKQASLKSRPDVSARSAIIMEEGSKRVLFQKDIHNQMRIASITKIMTAILAIESEKMNDFATVSERAVQAEGSSIYLEKGEKIKMEDLVYGLMLRSGNDAAVAISEHVGGSVEGFVYLMNKKAKEIGMEQTIFNNPHGLDDHEEHYSTAYDMALLTQYAMQNKDFRDISKTKKFKSRSSKQGTYRIFKNKNKLLDLYPYSTGGKTGYTKRAHRTLVSTALKKDMSLICVTLHASDDWNDHMTLFEWAFDDYYLKMIVPKGKIRLKGVSETFYTNRSLTYPLLLSEEKSVRTKVTLSHQTSKEKQRIGTVQIYLDEECIGSMPIFNKR